tara:strand:+ start:3780 stop:4157 length:378 start_codon:yes stop_codon:yes gene_type:complete
MKSFLINPKKLNPIEEFDENRVNWLLNKIKEEKKWKQPIVIAIEHNLVMDGHHRLEVALRLNCKKVPCYIFSYKEIKPYSLREDILVNSNLIIDNFLNSVIFPYKTAKHELNLPYFNPVDIEELK